jgi:hypothetical protein
MFYSVHVLQLNSVYGVYLQGETEQKYHRISTAEGCKHAAVDDFIKLVLWMWDNSANHFLIKLLNTLVRLGNFSQSAKCKNSPLSDCDW